MLPRPGAADLLKMAEQGLQDHVLGTLEGEAKYHVLMALRAIAIAKAELEEGAKADGAELKRIQALYDAPLADLAGARKQLAADIRARRFEPGTPREVRLVDLLTATTATRLRAVNIKYMVRRGRGAESAV
jgi:CO dehydrogenase/acetyl-CoA synthase alpha subunit